MASGKRQRPAESSLSFSSLPIHFERGFKLNKLFEFSPIIEVFRKAGIESMMVRKPELANATLVRDFYASWERSEDSSARVFIRGIPITVTSRLIQKILGLPKPPRGCPDFVRAYTELEIGSERYTEMVGYLFTTAPRGGTLHSGLLKKEFILLNLFLKFDLYPSSSYSTITSRDLVLLFWIATGQRFDVADVIFRMLGGTATSARDYLSQRYRQKVQLVYPFLITRICEAAGVPVHSTDTLVAGRAPLTSDTVKKSIAARGREPDTATSSQAPAPTQPIPPPPRDAPSEWTPQTFGDRLYALETGFHLFQVQYRSDQARIASQLDYLVSASHAMRPGSAPPPFYQPPSPPPPQQVPPPPPPPPRQPVEEGEDIGSSDSASDAGDDEDMEATETDDGDDDQ